MGQSNKPFRRKSYSSRNFNNRPRRNFSRNNRFSGEKIAHDRYIAKAKEGFIMPSIYAENSLCENFQINDILKKNIKAKGYTHPTKIQDQAIPEILKGTDIIGLASTGSGKTGAFLIPILDKIYKNKFEKCLIIVPTRELASQIQDEFRELSKGTNIFSTLVIGGTNIHSQIRNLKRNPHFVIGTPGRLKDLSQRKSLSLKMFNNIILDEVDRMLDMGFLPDISFLISGLHEQRQTLFFSATMSQETEKIARRLVPNAIRIQVEKESPLVNVNQDIVKFSKVEEKITVLTNILTKEECSKVLIFSRTKRGADKLSRQLYNNGLKADSIHGGKTQNRRLRVLSDFKTNQISILVATDVAARGLDIPNVSHVINYDEPQNFKDYIHRIGRTGRAGKTGKALTFVFGH